VAGQSLDLSAPTRLRPSASREANVCGSYYASDCEVWLASPQPSAFHSTLNRLKIYFAMWCGNRYPSASGSEKRLIHESEQRNRILLSGIMRPGPSSVFHRETISQPCSRVPSHHVRGRNGKIGASDCPGFRDFLEARDAKVRRERGFARELRTIGLSSSSLTAFRTLIGAKHLHHQRRAELSARLSVTPHQSQCAVRARWRRTRLLMQWDMM
jgi:hypothetical protein